MILIWAKLLQLKLWALSWLLFSGRSLSMLWNGFAQLLNLCSRLQQVRCPEFNIQLPSYLNVEMSSKISRTNSFGRISTYKIRMMMDVDGIASELQLTQDLKKLPGMRFLPFLFSPLLQCMNLTSLNTTSSFLIPQSEGLLTISPCLPLILLMWKCSQALNADEGEIALGRLSLNSASFLASVFVLFFFFFFALEESVSRMRSDQLTSLLYSFIF